jgi:SAM-dependent methyltransferase
MILLLAKVWDKETFRMKMLAAINRVKGAMRGLPVVGPLARFFHAMVRVPLTLIRSHGPKLTVVNAKPTMPRLVSQLATQEQMESDVFLGWIREMMHPHMYHRKLWEYVYVLQALRERGCLADGKRGLGFGVGTEPVAALMARHGCTVVATDLPPDAAKAGGWADSNQYSATLADMNKKGLCDKDRFSRLVSYRYVDMNDIPEDLRGFDFVWSCCAFDHLGSIARGLAFVHESLECLKPGGVAVHTTEFNLSSNDMTLDYGPLVLFRRSDFEQLARELTGKGHHITLNFTVGDKPIDRFLSLPPFTEGPGHIKILVGNYETTSIGLLISKGGERLPLSVRDSGREVSRMGRMKERIRPLPVIGTLARWVTGWVKLPFKVNRLVDATESILAGMEGLSGRVVSPGPPPVVVYRKPTMTDLVSQLPTQEQCESKTFLGWADAMKLPHYVDGKHWEYAYILQALDERGLLAPGKRGLGFGVGKEPLAAAMASRGCELVATDLTPDEALAGGWATTEQYAQTLADMNDKGICDPETFARLTTYRYVDMRAVPADLADFDFTWSCCSLEHLDTLKKGIDFIHESLRCLRPGGFAVHTTALNLSSNDLTLETGPVVAYRRRDIEDLARTLLAQGHEIVLNFTLGDRERDIYVDGAPDYRKKPGPLKYVLGNFVLTAIGLIIRKSG